MNRGKSIKGSNKRGSIREPFLRRKKGSKEFEGSYSKSMVIVKRVAKKVIRESPPPE